MKETNMPAGYELKGIITNLLYFEESYAGSVFTSEYPNIAIGSPVQAVSAGSLAPENEEN